MHKATNTSSIAIMAVLVMQIGGQQRVGSCGKLRGDDCVGSPRVIPVWRPIGGSVNDAERRYLSPGDCSPVCDLIPTIAGRKLVRHVQNADRRQPGGLDSYSGILMYSGAVLVAYNISHAVYTTCNRLEYFYYYYLRY